MSPLLIGLSIWLHTLATVVFIGYFLVLELIVIPPLAQAEDGRALRLISRRSRPWMYLALLAFILTGLLLMFADPSYGGIGNFSNTWSLAMLIKHIVVVAMIAAGFWYNAGMRVGPKMDTAHGAHEAITRFQRYIHWMSGLGLAVLLLTAMAQVY